MPTPPIWEARPLLARLEDPFAMFPLEGVCDTLVAAIVDSESNRAVRRGHSDAIHRNHWSVQDEHDHEKIGLLLGSVFVLGQAAITQTVSILNKLRQLPGASGIIPSAKEGKLRAHAATEPKTQESRLVVINAVSNYFKHSYEWSDDWNPADPKSREADTMRIVIQLGMSPQAQMTDNLFCAADALGLRRDTPRAVAECVQAWREAWARALYPFFGLPDPLRPQ